MKNKSKKLVVVLVILILLAMAVAYAAVSQTLTITGTARVTADVSQVIFTDSELASSSDGVVDNSEDPSFTDTTVTFDVTLPEPGAEATYTATITNKGNANAVLTSEKYYLAASATGEGSTTIDPINSAEHEGLKFEVTGIPQSINAGDSAQVNVRAYWDEEFTNIPAGTSKTMTLELIYGIEGQTNP